MKDSLKYYEGVNSLVLRMVPDESTRYLEVGCAKGKLGSAIKDRNPGSYYVGIELFEEVGQLAKDVLDKVFISDVEKFDWSLLSGEQFDCIIFADVLEHLIDPARVIKLATALLSPNGNIICCLPNVAHWSIISGLIRGEWEYSDNGLLDRTHLRFFTLQTFEKLLKEIGFEVYADGRFVHDVKVSDEIIPVLNAMQVDEQAFMERANTYQFVVRAQRIIKKGLSEPNLRLGILNLIGNSTVEIIVCVDNHLQITKSFLESLALTRFMGGAVQVLVLDNFTNDDTENFLKTSVQTHPWLRFERTLNPIGVAQLRNKAAGITNAEILVFLDGSTTLGEGWLEYLLDRIHDKRVGIVGPQHLFSDGSISSAGIVFTPNAYPKYLHRLAEPNDEKINRPKELPALTGDAMMIKREIFQAVGGFSTEGTIFYADLDLCFKVRKMGLSVVYQPESKVLHSSETGANARAHSIQDDDMNRTKFIQKWKELFLKELPEDPSFYISGRYHRPIKSKTDHPSQH